MELQWIKTRTDIFENRKIKMLESLPEGDTLVVLWFKLMSLAGKINDNGMIYFSEDMPYTAEMLSVEFNRPVNTIKLALSTFEKFKMIEYIDGCIHLMNWEEYQGTDKSEKVKEQTRARVAKHRENQKLLQENVTENITESVTSNVTDSVTCNAPVTQCNAIEKEIEIDKETKKEKEKKKEAEPVTETGTKRSRFVKPSIDELEAYRQEKNLNVDTRTFYDFYESKGWLVGKSPMKDWKATMRGWHNRERPRSGTPGSNKFINFQQRGDDLDAMVQQRVLRGFE
ncbi:MAG: phage replisome organizer N-terminal domain-containing protein [Butyrivibrio sp.]|nr:phage replisome organizer N-terminal domain-containing protein [Butyrivibrio sp.]